MSTLKMVLHGEKTLKTTIQKNLSKSQTFARKVTVAEFRYNQTIFFAVHSNFTYDSETHVLMKLYLETSLSESGRTTAVELFCGKLINLFYLEKDLRSFPHLGLHKAISDSPCLLILLIHTKHKNNKMKSWTHYASSFP